MMRKLRLMELKPFEVEELRRRNPLEDPEITETCRGIFADVQKRGDDAVREYTRRFDGVDPAGFEVGPEEWARAEEQVTPEVVAALEKAAGNIWNFHSEQLAGRQQVEVQEGVLCWREHRAIDPIGLYVPGGNAVLPSSVLMLGIPAQLAGCKNVIMAVPPRRDGSVAPEALVAASIAGIDRVFKLGGAQAIAALALGTETIPRVNKLLGPGNRWVQTAKLLATFHGVAIDMVAGPSEVLVIADEGADPAVVASDLIAQAEHGADSQSLLLSTSESIIDMSLKEVEVQLTDLPRADLARKALAGSFALLTETLEQAFDFSNQYAPEHLILQLDNPRAWLDSVQSAGSVFLGRWSPEVAGDYASGTNHTLPTSGMARAFSGVSVDSYVKKITFQELSREGLENLSGVLETLAAVEGLEGHRRAVLSRFSRK